MKTSLFTRIIFIAVLIAISCFILNYLYFTPYQLHARYLKEDPLYENDLLTKEDFEVYASSRLGKRIEIDQYRLSSPILSSTGLVAINSKEPHLATLVELNVIKVKDSQIKYNKKCYEGKFDEYKPKVNEIITYEDGREEIVKEDSLEIKWSEDKKTSQIILNVTGKNDVYTETFDMIMVDHISTDDVEKTSRTLSSDNLELTIHYEDGEKILADKKEISSDDIEKPKAGVNPLTCHYNGKDYIVKVTCKSDSKKTVTFKNYGSFTLLYKKEYSVKDVTRLNKFMGVTYFNNHRETFYTVNELGGVTTSLPIPGRHIAEDGTVRDEDGYICVASNYRFCGKYEVVLTSLGPAKVYDTGCRYGTIDLYVDW